jgi:large subunit ribosomal protein L28
MPARPKQAEFSLFGPNLLLQNLAHGVKYHALRPANAERAMVQNRRSFIAEPMQEQFMSRECPFTGKKTIFGRSISRRGKAKRLGGVGKKVTGISKRKFKPNIQKVHAVVDGKVRKVRVSTKAIRMGLIQKPVKRDYKPAAQKAG